MRKLILAVVMSLGVWTAEGATGGGSGAGAGAGPAITVNPGANLTTTVSAAPEGTAIYLMPGTYNVTNQVQLKVGQALYGSGMGNTTIKWWGYVVDGAAGAGNDWVCISLSNNVVIADMTITNAFASNNVFQACIGRKVTGLGGATNFLIERVSMHGDTDNFYVDDGALYKGSLVDCFFEGHWDTVAIVSLATGSRIALVNPTIYTHGPSTCKGSASIATPIRMNGANFPCVVTGGSINSTEVIGTIVAGSLTMYGTLVNYVGTNFTLSHDTVEVRTYGVRGLTYDKAQSNDAVTQQGSAVYFFDTDPQSFNEGASTLIYPQSATYFNTNGIAGTRIFNGVNWEPFGASYQTNKYVVAGASDANFNGVYTWKRDNADAIVNHSYTNRLGKFLMMTTNLNTSDGSMGLSTTEKLDDGLEFAVNSSSTINHNWEVPNAAIRVTRAPLIIANEDVGTDKIGYDLTLAGGRSTGTGRGGAVILQTTPSASTGSAANTLVTRSYISAKPVALTKSSAILVFNVSLASGKTLGLRLFATTRATDNTDFQARADSVVISAVNKAGTVTTAISTVGTGDTAAALSTGTMPTTWTAVANGSGVDVKCNAVPSLTPAAAALQVAWRIEMDTDDTGATITPQ